MNKKIRKIAAILAHIGLILAIVYLGFFIICSIRANRADAAGANDSDLYLSQAMHEHDFSFYTVGRALSDSNDPARENFLIALDLCIETRTQRQSEQPGAKQFQQVCKFVFFHNGDTITLK